MNKPKYIIKYTTKLIYGDYDCIYKVHRPVVKMLVCGLFYITIKKFFCKDEQIADISAKTLLNNLNKPYNYE